MLLRVSRPSVILMILTLLNHGLFADDKPPRHLQVAQKLIDHLQLHNTSYRHGKPDVSFVEPYRSHTDCSGFLDELIRHSYGVSPERFKEWFGRERPTADLYYDAIVKREHFDQINEVRQIRAGDILAIKYEHPKEKSTGHLLLVAKAPRMMKLHEPIFEGTEQWEIPIIDSARSGHGKTDTRHSKGENGKDHDGLGEGILRVYSDQRGAVYGYTWSVTGKHFLNQQEDHLVIGRIKI